MMKIGVISDTHIPLRAAKLPPAVSTAFAGVDLILHAGDLVEEAVLDELKFVAPVIAVIGNCDPFCLTRILKPVKQLELAGYRIGLTHGHLGNPRLATPLRALSQFDEVDLVVFGHSHTPYNEIARGVQLFNPGSPTDRRREPRYSVGLIELGQAITCQHVFF